MPNAHITGWGVAIPEIVLTNDEIAEMVDTSDEWIQSRTGIQERRIAGADESTASLAIEAAFKALETANISPAEVDLIIVSTSSPEHLFPATAALVQDGEQLKTRLTVALKRFWREAYAEEYESTRSLMERSAARNEARYRSSGFQEIFTAVTGRLVPEPIVDTLPGIAKVNFVPSCYVGPYVAYTQSAENLYLFYNCRSTPASETTVEVASLYPPLKALADETRLQILTLLQGRELYAQEIVEQLDISQPAVSRHLNLLATAGVLRIRRDGNARYYTVDGETLRRLASALRALA